MAQLPPGSPDRSQSQFDLAPELWKRFQQSGEQEDLDGSIACDRAALDLRPDGHPHRSNSLDNLGVSLWARYERVGQSEDLKESITLHRAALILRPEGHPDRSKSLNNLAISLSTRFKQGGGMEDLEESIALHRAALILCPDGHPGRFSSLNNLANFLCTRYQQCGGVEDLEESIVLHRDALVLRPEGHPLRSMSLSNLANSLFTRFKQGGRAEDLTETIALHREALTFYPEGHPDCSASLNNLAISLGARFTQGGELKDLEESITLNRTTLTFFFEGHPDRSMALNNLAYSLSIRFEQGGRVEDLEELIMLHRAALILRPEGHPDRSMSLNNLAKSLYTRFEQSGGMEDLEEFIMLHRAALVLRPDEHPYHSESLNNLANSLLSRFNQGGGLEDLEESIALHRDALPLFPKGHPLRPMSLNNLASSLFARFEEGGRLEDLDESIALRRAALTLCPGGHHLRSMSLDNLARALCTRSKQGGGSEELEESITLQSDALVLRPEGHPLRFLSLTYLANSLFTRFKQCGMTEDLGQSITLHRSALILCPEGHPYRSWSLDNLATSLSTRFEQGSCIKDLEESIRLLECAAVHPFSSLLDRLKAAQQWSTLSRSHDHHTTLKAYRTAISLLERTLTIRPTLRMQHDLLIGKNGFKTIALEAASYAIEKGLLSQAIELLEQGRALLWSQMRGFRTPLDQLAEVDKALADRFKDTSRQLEALATSSETRFIGASAIDTHVESKRKGYTLTDEMMALKRRLSGAQEELIREIREVHGFEDFLKPTPFETLQEAAKEGPIIMINHCKHRSDALIVLSGKDIPYVCVPLDSVFYSDTSRLYEELLETRSEMKSNPIGYDGKLREVMSMLWNRVVSGVVGKLEELGIEKEARIWWCPTSILTAFPFHAAGPFRSEDGKMKYLLDEYVSSYTPTLKSLINAQSGTCKGKLKLLVVGDSSLPSVEQEIEIIRGFKMPAAFLVDDQASRDTVVKGLRETKWVHFACHGLLDPKPFDSSFKLFNSGLTLLDVVQAYLPNAELAFLSACHTAEQSRYSAQDEVLHLAAAMHFCGFRSVIGTMWELFDSDGPAFAKEVYLRLSETPKGEARFKRSAGALRRASLKLKAQEGIMTERWVNVVHIGA